MFFFWFSGEGREWETDKIHLNQQSQFGFRVCDSNQKPMLTKNKIEDDEKENNNK